MKQFLPWLYFGVGAANLCIVVAVSWHGVNWLSVWHLSAAAVCFIAARLACK